jgi:hypothetical protein
MKVITAIVAALCVVVASSHADARTNKKHHRHYVGKAPHARIVGRVGGHRLGYEEDPFLYRNGGYGATPYFDARNFWERVQSGPFDEMTGPSAF